MEIKVVRQQGGGNSLRGKCGRDPLVTATFNRRMPFQRKQSFSIAATYPAKTIWGRPEVHREIYHDTDFMSAIQKANQQYPRASISIRTLGGKLLSPCCICRELVLESTMETITDTDGTRRVCRSHGEYALDLVRVGMQEAVA